jgi:hypothetical protein
MGDGMTPEDEEQQGQTTKVVAIILGVFFFLFLLSVALGYHPVLALREMIQARFR